MIPPATPHPCDFYVFLFQASLFGCEVNIGLSPNVGTQVLEFIDDSENKRRVRRGQSTCFECIDQGDVVLQVGSLSCSYIIFFTIFDIIIP